MKRRLAAFLVSLSTLTVAPSALAHSLALTISPLHLISPIFEVTGEVRLADRFGLALIAGAGSMESEVTDAFGGTATESFAVWEAGASARYYLLGDFDHGMQLGAELLYVNVDVDGETVSGTGNGLAIGPFIGYKVSSGIGFTFDSQLGFQYLTSGAEAESGGETAESDDSAVIPMLNLNVGWAF